MKLDKTLDFSMKMTINNKCLYCICFQNNKDKMSIKFDFMNTLIWNKKGQKWDVQNY